MDNPSDTRRRVTVISLAMKDLSKTLGVAESADDVAIKKAYGKLAKDTTRTSPATTRRRGTLQGDHETYAVLGDAQSARVRPSEACGYGRTSCPRASTPTLSHAPSVVRAPARAAWSSAATSTSTTSSPTCSAARRAGAPRTMGRVRPRQSRGADVIGQLPVTFAEAALGTKPDGAHGGGLTVEISIPSGVENGAGCAFPARAPQRPARPARPATLSGPRRAA